MHLQSHVVEGIKGLSFKKVVSECVESKAACCVFLTIVSPEEVENLTFQDVLTPIRK